MTKKLFLKAMQGIGDSSLELLCGDESYRFGEPRASLRARVDIHQPRFFPRALFGGDIGIGESYMDGEWSTPDLTSVIRLAVRNLASLEEKSALFSGLSRTLDAFRHRRKANTVEGSRRNIGAHYDLSNDFFRLFLDRNMVYSCAWYENESDSLESAQIQKLDRICRKLQLGPGDHVLEIGTGWGAFAVHAVQNYGCKVTTTTISPQQHQYARDWFACVDKDGRIELLLEDYRKLHGQYDKIVSIEMFEAVGYRYYDEYFRACDRLLKPDGSMLFQTININDQKFRSYQKNSDWIQKYIFPGAELASLSGILQSLARATRLSLYHAEDMGTHYARTLAEWRRRFHAALPNVRDLGFDERFIRMWDFYLAYCEGAFLERHISDFQILLTKNYSRSRLLNEPWGEKSATSIPTRS